jgi:hypothetical protein
MEVAYAFSRMGRKTEKTGLRDQGDTRQLLYVCAEIRLGSQAKKAKKVSGAYIAKVTPEGVVPKKKRVEPDAPMFSVEFRATAFLAGLSGDILAALREHFAQSVADRVWASAILRFIGPCPFKRIDHRYESSWLSSALPGLALSPASFTGLLDALGNDRGACAAFMRDTMESAPYTTPQ